MNRIPRRRALFVSCLLVAVFTVFSARLIGLQVGRHQQFVSSEADKHVNKQILFAWRGSIMDARGEPLAQNEPTRRVIADAALIRDREAAAALLAGPLEIPKAELLKKLRRRVFSEAIGKEMPCRYIVLKKDVPAARAEEIANAVETAKIRGIFSEQDSMRRYPNGSLLCHVIGYTNGENAGVDGIERTMDDFLRGNDGYRFFEHDRTGRELVLYRGQERAPRNGHHVKLTVDLGLQNIVETELDAAMKQFRPKVGVIVMMRPRTGEILALANRPHFDLSDLNGVPKEAMRNRAISDSYEPGSTFKIVATAAALTERIVKPTNLIYCENGYFGSYRLRDHSPHGELSVSDVLVKSSNIGVCKLALQLGDRKFYEYVRKFGFGERTNIALPGEENGILELPHRWSKLSISRLPMGHEINVTPLQMTAAMSAIANRGWLMLPQIVREVADADGNVVRTIQPQQVRQVASAEAADAVRDALVRATGPKGTAPLAHVSGFQVAGKTGTAQVIDGKGYSHERHRTSFVGFMPADAPEFTCLVMLDEPQTARGQDMGGLVCAPIFSRIAEKSARYLGLAPRPEPNPFEAALDPAPKPVVRRR